LRSIERRLVEAHWRLRTWRPVPERIVICRPHGGFNDTLVQFSATIRFAHRTHRRIILDLSHPGSGIQLPAEDLFTIPITATARAVDLAFGSFSFPSSCSWYPPETRDLAYVSLSSPEGPLTRMGSSLRLPSEDVAQHVIVHETWGGGNDHVLALKSLRLSEATASAVERLVAGFPTPEFATHLRFTDARVPIDDCLDHLASTVTGPLFIASDSEDAVNRARQGLPSIPILTLPQFRSTDERSIHSNGLTSAMFAALLADIYLLSSAKTFMPFALSETENSLSGISLLVKTFRSSPTLRRSFFGF
jgi:hypothetical protein